jgi:hypothetical protein
VLANARVVCLALGTCSMFGIPVGGQPGTFSGIGGSEMTEPLVGPFERFPLDFPVCNSGRYR